MLVFFLNSNLLWLYICDRYVRELDNQGKSSRITPIESVFFSFTLIHPSLPPLFSVSLSNDSRTLAILSQASFQIKYISPNRVTQNRDFVTGQHSGSASWEDLRVTLSPRSREKTGSQYFHYVKRPSANPQSWWEFWVSLSVPIALDR